MKNSIAFRLWGKYALFSDPVTRIGGEKCSYHVPTYESLRGIARSIYWKPTFVWRIDKVRIMKPIRTQTKSVKPLNYTGGNSLAFYNYLSDVEYHVLAHFEWNEHASQLECDRNENKHMSMLKRYLERGGTRDISLGTRECQGYVEPIEWTDSPQGFYKDVDEVSFGVMFHSFLYPEESQNAELLSRLWYPKMKYGVIDFASVKPEELISRFVCSMQPTEFIDKKNFAREAWAGAEI